MYFVNNISDVFNNKSFLFSYENVMLMVIILIELVEFYWIVIFMVVFSIGIFV